MFIEFPLSDEWKKRTTQNLLSLMHLNQIMANWPVVLAALRWLWETGKETKLETPYFEPFERPWGF